MSLSLAPFAFAVSQALDLYMRVIARDGVFVRPDFARKAVAARLAAGIRALEAFLRRLLILMALALEPDLVAVAKPENLARKKASMPRLRKPCLQIYPADRRASEPDFEQGFGGDGGFNYRFEDGPVIVPIGHLLARLDHLHGIVKDPISKARRLAFSLARSRHGILMAPPERAGILRRWGTEASAIYDAMAPQIIHKSKSRPPPLPPPRHGPKPMITVL